MSTQFATSAAQHVQNTPIAAGDFRRAPHSSWTALYAQFTIPETDPDRAVEVPAPDRLVLGPPRGLRRGDPLHDEQGGQDSGCRVCDGTRKFVTDPCPFCTKECITSSPWLTTSTEERHEKVCRVCDGTGKFLSTSCPFCGDDKCSEHIIHTPREQPSSGFAITLLASSGSKLGLHVASASDSGPWRIQAINGGLVQTWNDDHPGQEVKVGDHLLSINGVSDETEISQECVQAVELRLELSREVANDAVTQGSQSPFSIASLYDEHVVLLASLRNDLPGNSSQAARGKLNESWFRAPTGQAKLLATRSSNQLQGKLNTSLGFMKEKVGFVKEKVGGVHGGDAAQISDKAHRQLHYVKEQAKVASATMSVPNVASAKVASAKVASATVTSAKVASATMSHMAQKSAKLARRIGRSGGA